MRNASRVATILAAIVGIGLYPTAHASAADIPNILLIVSEDNGQELGCYGEPYVKTPFLDKLAEDGVRFHNAYVPQAGCSQSRAAYLTGLYPHQNGQIGLATWNFHMYREETPNMVRSLTKAGFRTGIIGKLHVNPKSAFPFDMHEISTSNFNRKKMGDYAKLASKFFNGGDKPFFLCVNYPDAHRPFIKQIGGLPKRPLSGDDVKPLDYFGLDTPKLREDTADYYNSLMRLDSLVGDLLQELDRSGKSEKTLVIYIGDHGADLLRGKRTSYEGGLRIPMIIRWPGYAKANQVRHELVSTLDLMPTLLAAAKVEPMDLPGRSLLPLMRNQKTDWRKYLFTEYHLHSAHNFFPQRTVRNRRYKLIHNLQPHQVNPGYDFTLERFFNELPSTIDSAHPTVTAAYRRMRQPPEFELYDLRTDPHELKDLASDPNHAAVLVELKMQLAAWRERTADPLLDPENVKRLKAEIDACMVDGKPNKMQLTLTYPDYFFTRAAAVPKKETLRLWPGKAPNEPEDIATKKADIEHGSDGVTRIPYVDMPELIRFPAPAEKACGTCMIVCPGGAYRKLAWNKEGTEIAGWLNTLGIEAFVLKYRVPRRNNARPHPWPLQDLQRAIRIVRSNANRWKIDPKRVGVMGFSAGGHLTAMATSQTGKATYEPLDGIDEYDVQPNFTALIYPAYLGDSKKDPANLDPLLRINHRTPPAFITITHDDSDRALFAALYYAQLQRHGVSGELHIYNRGGHGYGLRTSDDAVSTWPYRLEDWLRSNTWIK